MPDAERRIQQYRQSTFELTVVDQHGRPVVGAELDIQLQRHDFHFGTAVKARLLREETPQAVWYRNFITQNFTAIVAENAMKWYAIEKDQGIFDFNDADLVWKFAQQHNLALRGHCLLWSKKKFVQPWVQELTDEELRRRSKHFISSVTSRYPALLAWDGINELLDGRYYRDRLQDDFAIEVYQAAARQAPQTPLFTNEYHIIDSDERTNAYIALMSQLLAERLRLAVLAFKNTRSSALLTKSKIKMGMSNVTLGPLLFRRTCGGDWISSIS